MIVTTSTFPRRLCLLALILFSLVAGGSLQAATYVVSNTTGGSAPGSLGNAFAEAGLTFASDTISFSSFFDTPQTITMSTEFSPLIKSGIFTMAPSALLTVNSGNFSFLNLSGTTTYNVSNVDNQSTSAAAIVVNSGAILSVSNFDFDNR